MDLKKDSRSLPSLRRASAQLLAAAVLDLFPRSQLLASSVHDFGFSYDFIFDFSFDSSLIPLVEERMRALVKERLSIEHQEMLGDNASSYFSHRGQEVKAQLLGSLGPSLLSIFRMGDFADVCTFPFASNTSELENFRLVGFERLEEDSFLEGYVIHRISGVVCFEKKMLKKELKAFQDARRCDFRVLAKDLGWFDFRGKEGFDSWHWSGKGAAIRENVLHWWMRELQRLRFRQVFTTGLLQGFSNKNFPESFVQKGRRLVGHAFIPAEQKLLPRPSHAFSHAEEFRFLRPSYRDLPLRIFECGPLCYSEEGEFFWESLKTKERCIDTATVFCSLNDVSQELNSLLQFIERSAKMFNFGLKVRLSGRDGPVFTSARALLQERKFESECFIGEKTELFVEIYFIDSLSRERKGGFIRIDGNFPKRCGLRYEGNDGKGYIPMMISHTLFGSLERFVAILLEHYEGDLPPYLLAEQVRIVPVTKLSMLYAEDVERACLDQGIRATLCRGQERLGERIKQAQKQKVPYIVVIGEEETKGQFLSLRKRGWRSSKKTSLKDFLADFAREVEIGS